MSFTICISWRKFGIKIYLPISSMIQTFLKSYQIKNAPKILNFSGVKFYMRLQHVCLYISFRVIIKWKGLFLRLYKYTVVTHTELQLNREDKQEGIVKQFWNPLIAWNSDLKTDFFIFKIFFRIVKCSYFFRSHFE